MGHTTSEIAISTIPCCCDDCDINEEEMNERKSTLHDDPFHGLYDNNSRDSMDDGQDMSAGISDDELSDNNNFLDDDYMDDPENESTKSVIQSINLNAYNSYDEVWDILDEIFNSYASQTAIDTINAPQNGLKRGLQMLLDEYTQNALFESVSNLIKHRQSHRFNITQTMKINYYQKSKYKTQTLPFYNDDDADDKYAVRIVSNEHEGDDVCKYHMSDGTAYKSMEGDVDRRHRNFQQIDGNNKPLLILQYLSGGSLSNPFYKTKQNALSNKWYFGEHDDANEEDAECTLIAFNSFGQQFTSAYNAKEEQSDYGAAAAANEDDQRRKALLDSVSYINDVSYLAQYAVRRGYNKYGAVAYFDRNFAIIAIHTYWDKKIWSKPTIYTDAAYLRDWQYAKWCWKTSVIVSSHLTEWTIKCRFVEINSFVESVQKYLGMTAHACTN